MGLEAIAERKRLRKERRLEAKEAKLRRTNLNSDWARTGSRDAQHAKHVPVHGTFGGRPVEAFYDLAGGGYLMVVYDSPPSNVLGNAVLPKQVTYKDASGHLQSLHCAIVYAPGRPVRRLPHRLGVSERDFWVARDWGNHSLLQHIAGTAYPHSGRNEAYAKLQEEKEKIRNAPLQEPTYRKSGNWSPHSKARNAMPSTLESTTEHTYALYHDFPHDGDFSVPRRVLLLSSNSLPDAFIGTRAAQKGEVSGYQAALFNLPATIQPDDIANTLRMQRAGVRVGHYSDYGSNYLEEAVRGDASAARKIFQIADIPKAKGSTPPETNSSIAYVFYHDEGKYSVKDVLVLSDGDFPKEIAGVRPEFYSRVRGYAAGLFRFVGITSHELATSLRVDDALVRVGNYNEFGRCYLREAALGHAKPIECMLREAKLPGDLRNPNVKTDRSLGGFVSDVLLG